MKKTYLLLALLGSQLILLAGCGTTKENYHPGSTCTPSTSPQFAYTLTGYSVSMFTVDSCSGAFTSSTPSSIATGYSYPQSTSEQMVVDPLGRFAYVANPVSNVSNLSTISMYTIDQTTGALTATTPATVATGWFPQGIAIDPLGKFVYTANSDDNSISMFTINQSTGVLTPTVPASISTLSVNSRGYYSSPDFLTVDPTGKFLYASNQDDGTISIFTINATTGILTAASTPWVYTGIDPFQVIVAPSGKFAYVVDNAAGGGYSNAIWQYTIDSTTGVLTPNTPQAVSAGIGPTAIAIDPTSKYAYVANRQENTVSMFTIDQATGNLTPNTDATTKLSSVATGVEPFRIDFDSTGKFVYVTNEQSATSIFTVKSYGTLSSIGSTGVATGGLSTAFTTISK